MNENRIILPINPQTAIRTTQNEKILFRIPEKCYKGKDGSGCAIYKRKGLCKHTLSYTGRRRKRRIERYNNYKVDLLTAAKKAGFELPTCGWSIYFYVPIAKHVSKWKRKLMNGQLHLAKPDFDNFYKAIADSLSVTDEQISQLSGIGKFWIDTKPENYKRGEKVPPGYIEILLNQPIYNPFNVTFIDQKSTIKLKDEERQKQKMLPKPVKKKRRFSKRRKPEKLLT